MFLKLGKSASSSHGPTTLEILRVYPSSKTSEIDSTSAVWDITRILKLFSSEASNFRNVSEKVSPSETSRPREASHRFWAKRKAHRSFGVRKSSV
ncbi:hypothetical protein AVEN_275265-1 [Araneus ventricosus]|uniref:Uncharacterized protein n=1 Tax=Araneus ventricosus TaxID=182803 RepID=A0A4Y2Q0N2_ARAVE|nr:hypothetical protein AVEN_275265-1 [Araneus ventricosus]